MELLVFYPANVIQNDWIREHLSKASQSYLKKFLKFVTGSTSLPHDPKSKNIKLEIRFNRVDETKKHELPKLEYLPVSHTCMRMV